MKKKKIITIIIMITTILLILINPIAKATIDPAEYDPNKNKPSQSDVSKITDIANPIIGTLQVVGIVVAVITLGTIGLKYMTGSVSEKAEYKKTMIPYLIGAFLVVAITQILGLIVKIVTNVKT